MKISIVLLATALTVVGIPAAAADEAAPDCEADQPNIGYRTLLAVWDTAAPGAQPACEGEHWDGQDPINDGTASCNGTIDPANMLVAVCLGQDPNTVPGDEPLATGARVSADPSGRVYVAANIVLVGRASSYVGQDAVAVYLRDNTPGNLLAQAISAARVTQGFPGENDCDQATYQDGAMNPPSECGRDNTAITVVPGELLP